MPNLATSISEGRGIGELIPLKFLHNSISGFGVHPPYESGKNQPSALPVRRLTGVCIVIGATLPVGATLVPTRSLQIEAGVKRTSGSSERKVEWGQLLLRYGLNTSVELRLSLNSYDVIERAGDETKGREDAALALKLKIRGEAVGALPATSILPAASFPSGGSEITNDETLPSVTLLLDWSLGAPFSLSSNLGWSQARAEEEGFNRWSASVLLGIAFSDHLNGYTEVYAFNKETPNGDSTSFVDAGLVYEIARGFTVDATIGAGLDVTHTDYVLG